MIEVGIIAKKKAAAGGVSVVGVGSGYAGQSGVGTAARADYATKAGKAAEADHAAEADTAKTAASATEATHAASAAALDADSPTREDFLSAKEADEAAGEIAFEAGLKVGADGHGSKYGIGSDGASVLSSVETRQLCDDIEQAIQNRYLIGAQGYEVYVDEEGKSHLWVDELMVRVRAFFAALEVRKISYSGGTTLFSNAGSTLAKVVEVEDADGNVTGWKCYAVADDGTMRTMNWWRAGDQALCQTFNVASGVYGNVRNRYYWRLVTEVGQEELDGKTYDYVVLSNEASVAVDGVACAGYDQSIACDAPAEGDVIVQAGSQTAAAARGNVIMLTTSSEDGDGTAPSMKMYYAISDYSWKNRTALLSPAAVEIDADRFKLTSGGKSMSVADYVSETIGHNYEIVTDSDLALVSADSNGKMTSLSQASGLPVKVWLRDNGKDISAASWDAATISVCGVTTKKDGTSPAGTGLFVAAFYNAPSGDGALLSWTLLTPYGYPIKPQSIAIHIEYTDDDDNTIEIDREIPLAVTTSGASGTSVSIKGSLSSTGELPTSGNTLGDGYIISGDLWVYTGTTLSDATHVSGFENAGRIKGEDGDGAWDFRLKETPLLIADSRLDEVTDADGTVTGYKFTDEDAEILAYCGDKEAVVLSAVRKSVSGLSDVGVSADGGDLLISGTLPAVATTSSGKVAYVPAGSASITLSVKAESTDSEGNAISAVRDMVVPVSVAYTQHMGRLTLNDEKFETAISTVNSAIGTMSSRISQNAANITLALQNSEDIENGLQETGIDIESHKITVKSDTFEVQNNSGDVTAKVNADGVLETNDIVCNGGVFNDITAVNGTFSGLLYGQETEVNDENIAQYGELDDTGLYEEDTYYIDLSKIGRFVRFATKTKFAALRLLGIDGKSRTYTRKALRECLAMIGNTIVVWNDTDNYITITGDTTMERKENGDTTGYTSFAVEAGCIASFECLSYHNNSGQFCTYWLRHRGLSAIEPID